jgi:hypothetical protein
MAQSKDLSEKSIHAAVAAIEIYNKPDFHYREEAFALLITNAWELLLKAKWLLDHGENITSLYEYDRNTDGSTTPRTGRSGNQITFGLVEMLAGILPCDWKLGWREQKRMPLCHSA